MNPFVTSLQATICGNAKLWGTGINPLVIIGFTEAILDLGLPTEALHASVKSYARQLSAQVHPDRPTPAAPERQREIIEAFDKLQDLPIFQACLEDFRISRAEDRREIGLLRAEMKSLRRRYESLDATEATVRRDRQRSETEYQEKLASIAESEKNALDNVRRGTQRLEQYKLEFRESVRASYERRVQILEQHRQSLNQEYEDLGTALCRGRDTRWWRAPIGFG